MGGVQALWFHLPDEEEEPPTLTALFELIPLISVKSGTHPPTSKELVGASLRGQEGI